MTSPLDGKVAPFGQAVDKFHAFLNAPAGDIDTEAGSMPNLRKLSDELRVIAAVTADETAAGTVTAIDDRIYPGVYNTPPTNKPRSGAPSADGDRCVILVNGVPTEHVRLGGGWMIPNFDAQQLAQAATLPMMAFTAAEAQSIFDNALPLQSYTALRAYGGRAAGVRITTPGVAGTFWRDQSDMTSADNGGTIIVDASGRRWKRQYSGALDISWFGADVTGVNDSSAALQAAHNAADVNQAIAINGKIRCLSKLTLSKVCTLIGFDARNANSPAFEGRSTLLFSNPANAGITGSFNLRLQNLCFLSYGTGTQAYGINLTDASLFTEGVLIQTGVKITRGYYNKWVNTRIEYPPAIGVYLDNCYNVFTAGLSVRKAAVGGLYLANGSTMSMMGGSIEGFSSGYGCAVRGGSKIGFFGTYFEGEVVGGVGNRCVSMAANSSVTAISCHVYLSTMSHWITTEDETALGCRVFSRTNKLVLPADGFSTIAYNMLAGDATGACDIAGDNWGAHGGNALYVGPNMTAGAGPVQLTGSYYIEYPGSHPLYGKNIDTRPWVASVSKTTPASPSTGMIVNFANNGFGGDDPLNIHGGAWGYNSYQAVYQKGQWEKVGLRLTNQTDSTATDVATLKADFNSLLAKLRGAGVMI